MATANPAARHGVTMGEALRDMRADAGNYKGFWSWILTVDHKRIGVLYGVTSFFFFLVGGIEALLIRIQLARPDQEFLKPDNYNRIFTMHGTTMVFLVVMPLSAAFFNLMVPLMIGARDVAFPRMNAFSYWLFLFAGIFLNISFFTGGNFLKGDLGAPDGGWFGYAPLTLDRFSPGNGIDYWMLGLQMLGVASLAGGFNFVVTILNMRAPGMTLFRMPVFVWMALVTSFLIIFAMPVISVALFELSFDRLFNSNFFNASRGGTPLLWQHMFWLFGHPEVYILILPAMGIVSEVLPTFARKPLFGYPFVVFSGIAIGFMSWGVWAHHMYTTGLGSVANSAFGISTILIAVPTGVKIFNWMATLWGGSIVMKTPLYFAVGFIAMFTIGGLTGVTHSIVPTDYQQQDTYYIVAHFHQVLFGGAIFGAVRRHLLLVPEVHRAPARTRRMGKIHFWIMLHRLQSHLPADDGARPARHAAPHPDVPGRLRLGLLERHGHHRRVRHRDIRSSSSSSTSSTACGRARSPVTTRGTRARSSGRIPSPPPALQLRTRFPRCTRSMTSGTASTPRTRSGPPRPGAGRRRRRRARRSRRRRPRRWPWHPYAVAVNLPADRGARYCPSSALRADLRPSPSCPWVR